MAYVKPYNYVDGNILSATEQKQNEESAKVYVNQEITVADFDTYSLETTDIANYRYNSVTQNFDFVTKSVYGTTDTIKYTNRSYFSATPKRNQQVTIPVVQWEHIEGACVDVYVDRPAVILLTVYAHVIVNDNLLGVVGTPGQKRWTNTFAISREDNNSNKASGIIDTLQYVFGGAGVTPGAGYKDSGDGGYAASRRQFTFTYHTSVSTVGNYRFSLVCNPQSEIGYTTAKSITAEVFYI